MMALPWGSAVTAVLPRGKVDALVVDQGPTTGTVRIAYQTADGPCETYVFAMLCDVKVKPFSHLTSK